MPKLLSITVKMICVSLWLVAFTLFCPTLSTAAEFEPSGDSVFRPLKYADVVREDLTPLSLDEARARYGNGEFRPVTQLQGPDGLVYGPAWAVLAIKNAGIETKHWRLDSRAAFGNVQTTHTVNGQGITERVWHNAWTTETFADRYPRSRIAASDIIEVKPDEVTEVWISFPQGFYVHEELWLTENTEFLKNREHDVGFSSFVFGLRFALVVAIFAFGAILGFRAAIYYGVFATALLVLFLKSYGYSYAYWFGVEWIDNLLYFFSGTIALIFFTLMTRAFLNAPVLHPNLNRLLIGSMIFASFMGAAYLIDAPHVRARFFLSLGAMAVAGANLIAIAWGVRKGHSGAILFFIASLILFANMVVGTLAYEPFNLITQKAAEDINHAGFAFDMVLFAGAMVARALSLRNERDTATEAKLTALSEKAEIADQLSTVSDAHKRAVVLAEARRRELASTSHDLKQPLLSLQMSLKNRKDIAAVSEGITYLQNVVDKSLADTKPDEYASGVSQGDHSSFKMTDTFALDTVLKNVVTMLEDEASDKNIHLQAEPTSLVVRCEPVLLMRIVINLIANAVKHTPKGRVLIGARRRGTKIAVQIYDTGSGIAAEQLGEIFKPYKLGVDSKGEGLGLSVVRDLADAAGLRLAVKSTQGSGSMFEISGIERVFEE